MRKLGPFLAIFGGLALGALGTLSLLISMGTIDDMKWLADFKVSSKDAAGKLTETLNQGHVTATVVFGILIGIGALEIILGIFAWSNSQGFSAFILFGLIVTAAVFAIIGGVKANEFPTSVIIALVIQAISAIGMLSAFLDRK